MEKTTIHHNVKEILAVVKDSAVKVIKLNSERKEIQALITEAKAVVKAKGIKMADFNAALRLYELEADDRNESLDSLKICFEALELGGQSDLFPEKDREAA